MSEPCAQCAPDAPIVPLIHPGSPAELVVGLARDIEKVSGLVALVRDPEGRWEVEVSENLTRSQVAYALRCLTIVLDNAIVDGGDS